MIIYSVTVSLHRSTEAEWLEYMRSEHIPDVMAAGYFGSHRMLRLLAPEPEDETVTLNIQYTCESMGRLQAYLELAAPALQAAHMERFKDRFVAFRTVLEEL
jgi:hypothetical protein